MKRIAILGCAVAAVILAATMALMLAGFPIELKQGERDPAMERAEVQAIHESSVGAANGPSAVSTSEGYTPSPRSFRTALRKEDIDAFIDQMERISKASPEALFYLYEAWDYCKATLDTPSPTDDEIFLDSDDLDVRRRKEEYLRRRQRDIRNCEPLGDRLPSSNELQSMLINAAEQGSGPAQARVALHSETMPGLYGGVDSKAMLTSALTSGNPEVYLEISDWLSVDARGRHQPQKQYAWAYLAQLSGRDADMTFRGEVLCQALSVCGQGLTFLEMLEMHLMSPEQVSRGRDLAEELMGQIRAGQYEEIAGTVLGQSKSG